MLKSLVKIHCFWYKFKKIINYIFEGNFIRLLIVFCKIDNEWQQLLVIFGLNKESIFEKSSKLNRSQYYNYLFIDRRATIIHNVTHGGGVFYRRTRCLEQWQHILLRYISLKTHFWALFTRHKDEKRQDVFERPPHKSECMNKAEVCAEAWQPNTSVTFSICCFNGKFDGPWISLAWVPPWCRHLAE